MPSAKEQIAKILQDQPDDSSYEKTLRKLTLAQMVERGLLTAMREGRSAMRKWGAESRRGGTDLDR